MNRFTGVLIFFLLVFSITGLLCCKSDKEKAMFHIDLNWIEAHFKKDMTTKQLVDIRERLAPLGVVVKYLKLQRDTANNITLFQIEVHSGKGKLARSTTEFLDEIPYGIRIHRNETSDEAFKVGPLYTKRPE